jgi:hypothetical protein
MCEKRNVKDMFAGVARGGGGYIYIYTHAEG